MPPRIEFALVAGSLAVVLAMVGLWLMVRREFGEMLGLVAPAAGIAAALSALWTGRWRLFVGCRRRYWPTIGLAFFTVLVAMALFVLAVALQAWFQLPEGPVSGRLLRALDNGALLGFFALVIGGVPAWLLMLPVSTRYLRRQRLRLEPTR